jgi:hypothetical protein
MGGIAVAVQALKIITFQKTLRYVDLILRHSKPGVSWKYGNFVSRSHVGEDHSARLDTGVSGMMDFVFNHYRPFAGSSTLPSTSYFQPDRCIPDRTFVATVKQRSPRWLQCSSEADSP